MLDLVTSFSKLVVNADVAAVILATSLVKLVLVSSNECFKPSIEVFNAVSALVALLVSDAIDLEAASMAFLFVSISALISLSASFLSFVSALIALFKSPSTLVALSISSVNSFDKSISFCFSAAMSVLITLIA